MHPSYPDVLQGATPSLLAFLFMVAVWLVTARMAKVLGVPAMGSSLSNAIMLRALADSLRSKRLENSTRRQD